MKREKVAPMEQEAKLAVIVNRFLMETSQMCLWWMETNGPSVCNHDLQSNHKHCSTIWDPNGVQMTLWIY